MTSTLVDFHLHTTCSDGSWPPARLFDEIRARDVRYFSVSDHDTMAAYPVPQDLLRRCVTGVEIDTYGFEQTVHVLAYGLDPGCVLMARLQAQREERRVRAHAIVERLNAMGVPLTFEDVLRCAGAGQSVGRPHIARALVEAGHCADLQSAFDRYLAEGEGAYVPLERLSTQETIALVRAAGGLPVLAHPRRLRDQTSLASVCRLFDGIEAVHPSADASYQLALFELADANGLIATGGTDFHGRSTDLAIGVQFPSARLTGFLERANLAQQASST